MAIARLKKGNFQARLRGSDGKMLTQTFSTKAAAEEQVLIWKQQKRKGGVQSVVKHLTVDDYFRRWFDAPIHTGSVGWREQLRQKFADYVHPIIGKLKLTAVQPQHIGAVLSNAAELGQSEQSQLHTYGLLRRMFRDAIEIDRLITFNPVNQRLRPKVPTKETAYLTLAQLQELLPYVKDQEYGVSIWLQVYLGLRVSEAIALKWNDIDLDAGTVIIRRSYSRKDSWVKRKPVFRDYPKGRRQHIKALPPELWEFLLEMRDHVRSEFVCATSYEDRMLSYEFYMRTLKRYCRELGITKIGTHGLRHSTSQLYLHHGATRDDLRQLFAHSSPRVTDRYIHGTGSNLEKVGRGISILQKGVQKGSEKRPTLRVIK